LDNPATRLIKPFMKRLLIFAAILLVMAGKSQAGLGWTLDECEKHFGAPYGTKKSEEGRTAYQFSSGEKWIVVSLLADKVSRISYSQLSGASYNSGQAQAFLAANAPLADWGDSSVEEDGSRQWIGKIDGRTAFWGLLEASGDSLTIWTQEDNELVHNFHAKKAKDMANEDALATPEPTSTGTVTPSETSPVTNVVSAITGNRWTTDALIVSGTLTNTSAVAVQIRDIDAVGFNKDQKMVTRGSDFTIFHNDLAPGEVVNFKVALKDDSKQVKFVKVLPTWTP
jgi:hypothetical protein